MLWLYTWWTARGFNGWTLAALIYLALALFAVISGAPGISLWPAVVLYVIGRRRRRRQDAEAASASRTSCEKTIWSVGDGVRSGERGRCAGCGGWHAVHQGRDLGSFMTEERAREEYQAEGLR
jgi:hypothetical protein